MPVCCWRFSWSSGHDWVVVAILAIGAGRWAIVRSHGEAAQADASADTVALDAAHQEISHAEGYHGVAIHHGGGHGAGHGGSLGDKRHAGREDQH
jgi:hypothetical protein